MKSNKFGLAATLLALAVSSTPFGPARVAAQEAASPASELSPEDEARARAAFKEGNAHMEAKRYEEALGAYKRALAILPNDPSLLWNGGTSAFLSHDYASALSLWKRLKAQDPRDGAVRAKLIQTYAAQKNLKAREAERRELFALRAQARKKNPKAPALAEKTYCRDQFKAAGRRVLAYEFFELEGERARRYNFVVLKKDAEQDVEDFHISLGSYKSTNDYARESGTIKKGGRLFHLDGYYAGGLHKTFDFFDKEPSYDQTRAMVEAVLAGRKAAVSSSQRER